MRLRASAVSALLLLAVGDMQPAQAQEWPQRAVRIIDAFAAGGSSDVAARIVGQHLAGVFGIRSTCALFKFRENIHLSSRFRCAAE